MSAAGDDAGLTCRQDDVDLRQAGERVGGVARHHDHVAYERLHLAHGFWRRSPFQGRSVPERSKDDWHQDLQARVPTSASR